MLKDQAVRDFLVVQQKDFSVELQLVPDQSADKSHVANIARLLAERLPGVAIAVKTVSEISRPANGKRLVVISHVDTNVTRLAGAATGTNNSPE